MELRDLPVLVTGGASGLGAATVRHLGNLGARVCAVDLSADAARSVAEDVGGLGIGADVTDHSGLADAFASAREAHGPVRALVCCAGIAPSQKIVDRDGSPHDLALFSSVVSVNLVGTFNALRIAAAEMTTTEPFADGERGVIINTASIAAYEGQIGQAAYAASKAGVVGMTLPAARELSRHGVRVAAIAPGVFGTPMLDTVKDEVRDAIAAGVPWPKREGRPQEYARLAQFIVENPMVNGSVHRLDGALRLA